MFYLFNVNQGHAQFLDVTAALGSVQNLQNTIEKITGVPAQDQVLLIDGGEGLRPDRSMASYQGCGTDSNPVFLFYKIPEDETLDVIPSEYPEIHKVYQEMDKKLIIYEDASLSSSLAERYIESSRIVHQLVDNAYHICSRIFQEHHFMHQGWLALTSNFDECRRQIQKKVEKFFVHYEKMNTMKSKAQSVVQDFDAALDLMEKIIIPPSLLEKSTLLEVSKKFNGQCSLYDFISAVDPENSLRDVVTDILESIDQMDDSALKEVKMHSEAMQARFSKTNWQEIGGINGRLDYLDRELRNVERRKCQMEEIRTSISQAGHSSRGSVKDIVAKQRKLMADAKKCMDIAYLTLKSFVGSKQEILINIRDRLSKLALKAYDRLHMLYHTVTVYEEKYTGLRNRLDIIRQVKESPVVYIMSVSETVRRSILQQEFMVWFTKFMEKSQKLVSEETSLRDAFANKLEHHFLKQLFPGLFDAFPIFAPTQLPNFDQNLPPVDVSYISSLKQALPSHAHLLKVNKPFIYNRLAIGDVQPICLASSSLGRDDSFTGPASPGVATVFTKNFPSTNWLSGDENVDLSPSNAVFFAKTPTSQCGSSLDLDVAESPSQPLNSLPPSETLFPCQEIAVSAESQGSQASKFLPVKILNQRDPMQFEFHRLERLSEKEIFEHLKTILSDVKKFSETLILLKESQNVMKNIFGDVTKEITTLLRKKVVPQRVELEAVLDLGIQSASVSQTENEDAFNKLIEKDGKEVASQSEEKSGELNETKDGSEINCEVEINVALQAKLKEAMDTDEKEWKQKSEAGFQAKLEKAKEDVEKECAARFEKVLDEMLVRTRLETESELRASCESQMHDELQKKYEESVVVFEKELEKRLTMAKEETESRCRLQYETKLQNEIENLKAELDSDYAKKYERELAGGILKIKEDFEIESAKKFDFELSKEIEIVKDSMKKECMAKYAIKLKEELEKAKEETEKSCMAFCKKKFEEELEKERASLTDHKQELEKLRAELEETRKEAEEKLADVQENCLRIATEQRIESEKLCSRQVRNETLIEALKCERAELLKALGLSEDLIKEMRVTNDEDILKDEKLKLLLQNLQKIKDSKTQPQAVFEKSSEEIKATLDREYMSKMHLLMKGHEDKKAKEIARVKSEAESELRCRDYRIHELEQLVQTLQQSGAPAVSSLSLPNMAAGQESVFECNSSAAAVSQCQETSYVEDSKDYKNDRDDEEEKSEEDITALAVNTRGVQTRLRVKDLRYMISVQDLRELSTVLVVYSETHEAYILFSISSSLYFVKESCLRKLGLKSDEPVVGQRKNWLLGVMTKMEFCQIRKTSNRYNLAVGTRFYRVEVEPLLIDSSVRRTNDD